jgi:hypothetical protein
MTLAQQSARIEHGQHLLPRVLPADLADLTDRLAKWLGELG